MNDGAARLGNVLTGSSTASRFTRSTRARSRGELGTVALGRARLRDVGEATVGARHEDYEAAGVEYRTRGRRLDDFGGRVLAIDVGALKCEIDDTDLVVSVLRIDHHSDVYRPR